MTSKRQIRVFIASPSDLDVERKAFRDQIVQLNLDFGDGANVEFIPLGWEDTLASTGPRTQSVFNRLIDSCDIFVLTLSRRWGRDASDSEYSSYTEEEFHRALQRYKKDCCPVIFIFFKGVDTDSLADPGTQLQKILDFKLSLEETGSTRYWEFNDPEHYASLLNMHLRAFAKGEIQPLEPGDFQTPLPLEARHALQAARKEMVQINQQLKAEIIRANNSSQKALHAEELALELAMTASEMALEGKIEKSKVMFAKAVQLSTRLKVIHLAAEFYLRIGNMSEAESLFSRGFAGVDESNAPLFLAGLGNLATIKGDWKKAEAIFRKMIAIEEKLGHPVGAASSYGLLGTVFKARGEIAQAKDMYQKALGTLEKLDHQEMMAVQYNNLGVVLQLQGDWIQAKDMYQKALVLNEKLGNQERVADAYGNLGSVLQIQGDLDQSEEMNRKALELDEKLGRLEGMACTYNNMGSIFKIRGDLVQAEIMHRKSLTTYEKLGRPPGMADAYGNLGAVLQLCGKLDQAEAMHFKALEIDEEVGNLKGMANSYLSLGILSQIRGDRDKAEQLFRKALAHFEILGAKDSIAQTNKFLHSLRDSSLKRFMKSLPLKLAMNLNSHKISKGPKPLKKD